MTTWRDKQRSRTDPIAAALAAWHAGAGQSEHDRMSLAIDAHEAADAACRECDEPGCTREATCGWPVKGGYRRTCAEHMA